MEITFNWADTQVPWLLGINTQFSWDKDITIIQRTSVLFILRKESKQYVLQQFLILFNKSTEIMLASNFLITFISNVFASIHLEN